MERFYLYIVTSTFGTRVQRVGTHHTLVWREIVEYRLNGATRLLCVASHDDGERDPNA